MVAARESEIDRLYALPLGEFTDGRNELVRKLRKQKLREEADEVAALRKPSVAAWVVNQLARESRREIDLLLDAGHRIRDGQTKGNREAFAQARQTEREALQVLGKAAEQILNRSSRSNTATLDRVLNTLRAAAVTPEGRELLARGRLENELAPVGFEQLTGVSLPAANPRKRQQPAKREQGRTDLKRARQKAAAARAQLAKAEGRRREAERAATSAQRALETAEAKLVDANKDHERAEQTVREADQQLDELTKRDN